MARSASHTPQPVKPLGSYLVEAGLITPAQVAVALNDQQLMMDMRFGEVLVARGWIKQQTLDFLMRKVVEPEQAAARQPIVAQPIAPQASPPPPAPSPSVSQHPDLPHARLVQSNSTDPDATLYLEIVPPPFQRSPVPPSVFPRSPMGSAPSTPPSAHDTTEVLIDPTELVNDRKPLPSVTTPEDDGVNWVG